ncbi:uncharacterized protein LOC143269086 [Peromyscus maniculatus bairdii]|uniref:uncharacterized protein LOC143269086 n=1 Tax=Peromyscus maniculatus bairdii TaxID=230844 RepID=UPI003FCF86C4
MVRAEGRGRGRLPATRRPAARPRARASPGPKRWARRRARLAGAGPSAARKDARRGRWPPPGSDCPRTLPPGLSGGARGLAGWAESRGPRAAGPSLGRARPACCCCRSALRDAGLRPDTRGPRRCHSGRCFCCCFCCCCCCRRQRRPGLVAVPAAQEMEVLNGVRRNQEHSINHGWSATGVSDPRLCAWPSRSSPSPVHPPFGL